MVLEVELVAVESCLNRVVFTEIFVPPVDKVRDQNQVNIVSDLVSHDVVEVQRVLSHLSKEFRAINSDIRVENIEMLKSKVDLRQCLVVVRALSISRVLIARTLKTSSSSDKGHVSSNSSEHGSFMVSDLEIV